jgi:hypothetical protein
MPRNPNTPPSIDHQPPQPIGSGGKTLFDRPEAGPKISRPTQPSPTAAAVSGIMLAGSEIATGQQEPSELQLRKADLEVEKLELEVSGLRKDNGELLNWLTGVFWLLLGVVGTATSV